MSTRRYTLADVDSFPDDGNRYEIIDGELFVTPPPSMPHQLAASMLFRALHDAKPRGFIVFAAPIAVQRKPENHLEPDVSVLRREEYGAHPTTLTPVLLAEIASPSTRRRDRLKKAHAYARMGVPSYWLIDPDIPSLTVLELGDGGTYRTVAEVSGDTPYDAINPYPVRVVPNELFADLRE